MKHFHGWAALGATQQFAARHCIRPHVERFPVTRVNEAPDLVASRAARRDTASYSTWAISDLTHPCLSLDTGQR